MANLVFDGLNDDGSWRFVPMRGETIATQTLGGTWEAADVMTVVFHGPVNTKSQAKEPKKE